MAHLITTLHLKERSLKNLQKCLPADSAHVLVASSEIGRQPPRTYYVVSVHKAFKNLQRNGVPYKRLALKEVQDDGSEGALLVDMFAYGDHAMELEQVLRKTGLEVWLVMRQVQLSPYIGYPQDGWAKFCLSVGAGYNNVGSAEAGVWVVSCAVARSPWGGITFINKCEDKTKVTICAVVKKVLKHCQLTKNGNLHSLLAVVDSSCGPVQGDSEGLDRRDILVHIFMNQGSANDLEGGVNVSDILLIRDMLIEVYNDKYYGKVFNLKQVVKFSSVVSDPLDPTTSSNTFIMTDDQRQEVSDLRVWWAVEGQAMVLEAKEGLGEETSRQGGQDNQGGEEVGQRQAGHGAVMGQAGEVRQEGQDNQGGEEVGQRQAGHGTVMGQAGEVRQGGQDNQGGEEVGQKQAGHGTVMGQAREVRQGGQDNQGGEEVGQKQAGHGTVMRQAGEVRQGGTGTIPTLQSPQADKERTISDITQDHHFILLCQVVEVNTVHITGVKMTVLRVQDGTLTNSPFVKYDLGKEREEEQSRDGSSVNISGSHTVDILCSTPVSNFAHIQVGNFVCLKHVRCQAVRQAGAEQVKCKLTMDPFISTLHPLPPDHTFRHTIQRSLGGPSVNPEQIRTSQPSASCGERRVNGKGRTRSGQKGSSKRLRQSSEDPRLSPSSPSPPPPPPLVTTVVSGEFERMTVDQIVKGGELDKVYQVMAVVRDLQAVSPELCHTCHQKDDATPPGSMCKHLWVWGVCEECNTCFPSQDLLHQYPHPLLRTCPALPCFHCSQSGTSKDETKVSRAADTILPFIRLTIILADPDTGLELPCTLTADHADTFFGVLGRFSWVVGEGRKRDEQVSRLAVALLKDSQPHLFAVKKTGSCSSQSVQCSICHTSLTLI